MKKKRGSGTLALAGAVCALGISLGAKGSVLAEEEAIHSKGNLVFREGQEVAVYASDIHYLQEEVDRLYAEFAQ